VITDVVGDLRPIIGAMHCVQIRAADSAMGDLESGLAFSRDGFWQVFDSKFGLLTDDGAHAREPTEWHRTVATPYAFAGCLS
jgi:hypothetical protein